MVRVLHAMAGAPRGGAEAFFERLTVALAKCADLEQQALIRRNPERSTTLRTAGIPVTEAPFGGRLDLVTPLRFRRRIREFKPHVILTWMNRASRLCPAPGPKDSFVTVARLGGYYDLKYYRHCQHMIGNTPDLCQWLIAQGRHPDTVHYLPNFADERPLTARQGNTDPNSPPIILALGRLHPNKAFDTLLHALTLVPDAVLWLAGTGPEHSNLNRLVHTLGVQERVQFLGWRSDIAELHARATLFVCPSRHEPLGNVILEAWANGSPVVATAAQGAQQMITDGENGLLVPVDEASALGAAMQKLLTDTVLRDHLARSGQAFYQNNFSQAAVVERYCAFFRAIARLSENLP